MSLPEFIAQTIASLFILVVVFVVFVFIFFIPMVLLAVYFVRTGVQP